MDIIALIILGYGALYFVIKYAVRNAIREAKMGTDIENTRRDCPRCHKRLDRETNRCPLCGLEVTQEERP